MRTHPMLNVNHIIPDPELVGQLPRSLALYYMALPLGREDDQVSVALAHPENTTALTILSRLLGGSVVPVRGATDAIRTALLNVQPAQAQPDAGILGWSPGSTWTPAVEVWVHLLAEALNSPASLIEAAENMPNTGIIAVSEQRYRLRVFGLPPQASPDELLHAATGPLLLVREPETRPLRRILVALRGFSSDDQALDWVTPLAHHSGAAVTLLPITAAPFGWPSPTSRAERPAWPAIDDYLRRFRAGGTQTSLRLRQGNPVQQIADEAEQGDYDLLVVAAEGVGEFVSRVLAEVSLRPRCAQQSVFVLKPSYA